MHAVNAPPSLVGVIRQAGPNILNFICSPGPYWLRLPSAAQFSHPELRHVSELYFVFHFPGPKYMVNVAYMQAAAAAGYSSWLHIPTHSTG